MSGSPAARDPGHMTMQLDHIVLNVNDIDLALDFYVGVLGLAPERVDLYRNGEVLFPSVRINADTLIDLMGPELRGPDVEPAGSPNVEPSGSPNMDHLCLSLSSERWHAIVADLDARNIEIEAGPMTLWGAHGDATAVYIQDRDGNRVELRYYED